MFFCSTENSFGGALHKSNKTVGEHAATCNRVVLVKQAPKSCKSSISWTMQTFLKSLKKFKIFSGIQKGGGAIVFI